MADATVRQLVSKHCVLCSVASGHAGEVALTVFLERLGLEESGGERVAIRLPPYLQAQYRFFPARMVQSRLDRR